MTRKAAGVVRSSYIVVLTSVYLSRKISINSVSGKSFNGQLINYMAE